MGFELCRQFPRYFLQTDFTEFAQRKVSASVGWELPHRYSPRNDDKKCDWLQKNPTTFGTYSTFRRGRPLFSRSGLEEVGIKAEMFGKTRQSSEVNCQMLGSKPILVILNRLAEKQNTDNEINQYFGNTVQPFPAKKLDPAYC